MGVSMQVENPCELDDEALCPKGWVHVGSIVGYCYAPKYTGPCRPALTTASLKDIGAARMGEACQVSWPCKLASAATRYDSTVSGPMGEDGRVAARGATT